MSGRTAAPYVMLAPHYDALLGGRFFPPLRRAFEGLVRLYGVRFSSAADVACGTGTFVRYLCERGVAVVYGVDRSPDMLGLAITKNRNTGARFLLQDFATLQLPQPVDLITCNFDSLNYLLTADDLLRALRHFHANLKSGGHVIFDMVASWPRREDSRPHVERVAGSGVSVRRITFWEPRLSTQTALVSIFRNGHSQGEIHVQRAYPQALVADLLVRAGFALLGVHDFQTLGPATRWTTREVYVASSNKVA